MSFNGRQCCRCGQRKPIAGGKKINTRGRGTGSFVCADCDRLARVISGTGNSREQRELAVLNRGLRT